MILLHREQLQTICDHAARTYPDECCGLLLGRLAASGKVVEVVRSVENSWDPTVADELAADELADGTALTKTRRYWIDPAAMLAAMRDARSRELDIIGIYHSHPDNPAIPSECDRRLAWSQYSYLIVSVPQGTPTDTRSWQLDEQHQFQPEPIEMAEFMRM